GAPNNECSASSRRRVVHGQIESSRCRALPDRAQLRQGLDHAAWQKHAVDGLVIDSVAALVPRAELEGEMGDSQPGLQARLMSQALRKLTASINRSRT